MSMTSGIPTFLEEPLAKAKAEQEKTLDLQHKEKLKREEEEIEESGYWMWFEFTPYEVGCDEIGGKETMYLLQQTCNSCLFQLGFRLGL